MTSQDTSLTIVIVSLIVGVIVLIVFGTINGNHRYAACIELGGSYRSHQCQIYVQEGATQ